MNWQIKKDGYDSYAIFENDHLVGQLVRSSKGWRLTGHKAGTRYFDNPSTAATFLQTFYEGTDRDVELQQEFLNLKQELFGAHLFVVAGDSEKDAEKWARYTQLLAYFVPLFRSEGWVNPLG